MKLTYTGSHPQRHGELSYIEGRIDIHGTEPSETNHWLYVFQDRSGMLKIGYTCDIYRKYYVMGQQVPKSRHPMRFIHAIEIPAAAALESALHKRFAKHRVFNHGPTTEWFRITPATYFRAVRKILMQ
jgi:hypothetical protein